MKRISSLLIIFLLLVILMILTNPSQDQFVNWALEQAEQNASSGLERIIGDVIGKPVLHLATSRENYLLFSTFTVQQGGENSVYIGLLRIIFFKIPFLK